MRRPPWLFWVLIGGLMLAGIGLVARHGSGTVFGMASADFARLTLLVAILVSVGAAAVARGTLGRAVRFSLAWVGIGVILIAGYTFRTELEWAAMRVLGELSPGTLAVERSADGAVETVVVSRGAGGQFFLQAEINGAGVPMLVDTGASIVTLSYEDAVRIGFDADRFNFRVPVMTANGSTQAAPIVLDTLAVGPIVQRRVPALVARPRMLAQSLLGMNFLNRITSFSLNRDRLVLTP